MMMAPTLSSSRFRAREAPDARDAVADLGDRPDVRRADGLVEALDLLTQDRADFV
jgi:hypothetical protein